MAKIRVLGSNPKRERACSYGVCVITGHGLTTAVLHGLTCNALLNHDITWLVGFGGTHLLYCFNFPT